MRRSKLPKREVEICQRLRFAREEVIETTQANCAEQTGIERSTLANYESQRTPLRFDVALRFCRQFIISEEWLATGRHDACHAEAVRRGQELGEDWARIDREIYLRQCLDLLSDPVALHIKPGTLFSEAYDKALAARYAEGVRQFYYVPRISLSDADDQAIGINFLKAVHERHLKLLEHEAVRLGFKWAGVWRLYIAKVYLSSDLIFRKVLQLQTGQELPLEYLETLEWLRAISNDPAWPIGGPLSKISAPGPVEGSSSGQVTLDTPAGVIDDAAMQALKSIPDLVSRLKRLSKKYGSKAALARKLDVSRQAVDQWMNGKTTPSTDIAIKVMNLE